MTEKQSSDRLTLLKMEYRAAAQRYENIYRAMWQIFSYMLAISSGILVFGKDTLETWLLFTLVLLPLYFWFFSTFVPLDKYGSRVRLHSHRRKRK